MATENTDQPTVAEETGIALRFGMSDLIARVETRVALFADVTEPYDLADMKRDRAGLRSESKDLNGRRIAAEKAYSEAFVREIKTPVRKLTDRLDNTAEKIDGWIKEAEGERKAKKRALLEQHFRDYAGVLTDAVTFEQIEDPAWLNETFNIVKATDAIEDRIEQIAADVDMLAGLKLTYADDARAEYLATLDITRAIARDKQLREHAERNARLKADEEAIRAERLKADEEAIRAAGMVGALGTLTTTQDAEGIYTHTFTAEPEPAPEVKEWTFTFIGTRDQAEDVGRYLAACGLTGSLKGASVRL